MESKLGLNLDLVEKARTSAANVAADVQGLPWSAPSAVCWASTA